MKSQNEKVYNTRSHKRKIAEKRSENYLMIFNTCLGRKTTDSNVEERKRVWNEDGAREREIE